MDVMVLMGEQVMDPFGDLRQAAVPFEPVVDPAGWTAAEMAAREDWLYSFNDDEIAELRAAIAPFDHDDIDLMTVEASDLPLPSLATSLRDIRQELLYGRGFVMFRGLPVEEMGKRASAVAFWAVSRHLGDNVFSQNKRGHVLGHVTDLGESRANPSQRGPYSREEIPFHVDCCDIVGLLCMETPLSGGESSIVSSVTLHNEILKRRPDLARIAAEPYYRDRRDEVPPGMQPYYKLPIFNFYQGYFSANVEPTYIGSANRFKECGEMSPAQKEALELSQSLARDMRFDQGFSRGDMQFVNNHVIFHSRRSYVDHADPDRKRHLLRVWLKALDGRPLPDAFYERHGTRETIDRPGGIVGLDTVLNAPIYRE
jgi:hypothetical protein|tara:strand:+ start:2524 stop:3633 length:1110 start_codon:yes stop_codon:yes gene_type:complete